MVWASTDPHCGAEGPSACNNPGKNRVFRFEVQENEMIARFALAFFAALTAFMLSTMPAAAAEPIGGRWVTEERDAIIEIRRCGSNL